MTTTAKSKSTKTNPAHKAASKPTAAKATKAKTTKAAKVSRPSASATKSPCRGCEIFFGIIMIILALTMIADVIVHLCIWLWK